MGKVSVKEYRRVPSRQSAFCLYACTCVWLCRFVLFTHDMSFGSPLTVYNTLGDMGVVLAQLRSAGEGSDFVDNGTLPSLALARSPPVVRMYRATVPWERNLEPPSDAW